MIPPDPLLPLAFALLAGVPTAAPGPPAKPGRPAPMPTGDEWTVRAMLAAALVVGWVAVLGERVRKMRGGA